MPLGLMSWRTMVLVSREAFAHRWAARRRPRGESGKVETTTGRLSEPVRQTAAEEPLLVRDALMVSWMARPTARPAKVSAAWMEMKGRGPELERSFDRGRYFWMVRPAAIRSRTLFCRRGSMALRASSATMRELKSSWRHSLEPMTSLT